MNEKLSNEAVRIEKINEIKTRGLKEIIDWKVRLKELIRKSNDTKECDYHVKEYYALTLLEDYFNKDYCMMDYEYKCQSDDIVIYMIPIKYINIWLADDNLLNRYLMFIFFDYYENGINVMMPPDITDKMLGYDDGKFISAIESIEYDEKHKDGEYNV